MTSLVSSPLERNNCLPSRDHEKSKMSPEAGGNVEYSTKFVHGNDFPGWKMDRPINDFVLAIRRSS
jgi:hypothetical protein